MFPRERDGLEANGRNVDGLEGRHDQEVPMRAAYVVPGKPFVPPPPLMVVKEEQHQQQKQKQQQQQKQPEPPPTSLPVGPALASMSMPSAITITVTQTLTLCNTSVPLPSSLARQGAVLQEVPFTSAILPSMAATPAQSTSATMASATAMATATTTATPPPSSPKKEPPPSVGPSHDLTVVAKVAIVAGALFGLGIMFGILWSVLRRKSRMSTLRQASSRRISHSSTSTTTTTSGPGPGPGPDPRGRGSRNAMTQSQLMDEMMTAAYAVDAGMYGYDDDGDEHWDLFPADEKTRSYANEHQSVYSFATSRVSALSAEPTITPLQGPPRHLQHQQDNTLLRPAAGLPLSPRRVPMSPRRLPTSVPVPVPFSPRRFPTSPRRPPSSLYASTIIASPSAEDVGGRQSSYFDVLSLYARKSRIDSSMPPVPPPVPPPMPPPLVVAPLPFRRAAEAPTHYAEGFGNRGEEAEPPPVPGPVNNDNWTWLMTKMRNVI